jgi:hypothetical protein
MTIEISPEVEARLIDEARKQGTSVETLLERLVTERLAAAEPLKSVPELPVWHLGEVGSLRRVDVYEGVAATTAKYSPA